MLCKATENFFDTVQVKWTLQWNSLFEAYEADYSPKKESLTEMTSYFVKPSKNFLSIYMTNYLYSDTLLWSYLSAETNGVISRHIDQILSLQTWTSSHFSAFIITQPGLSREWKSPKMSEFCFFWPPTGVNMGGRHVYRFLKVAQWLGLAPPTISWKYLSNSRRNPKKLDTPPLRRGFGRAVFRSKIKWSATP